MYVRCLNVRGGGTDRMTCRLLQCCAYICITLSKWKQINDLQKYLCMVLSRKKKKKKGLYICYVKLKVKLTAKDISFMSYAASLMFNEARNILSVINM